MVVLKIILSIFIFIIYTGVSHSGEFEYYQIKCKDDREFSIKLKRKGFNVSSLYNREVLISRDEVHNVDRYTIFNTEEPVTGVCDLDYGAVYFEIEVEDIDEECSSQLYYRKLAKVKLWVNYNATEKTKTLAFEGVMGQKDGVIISKIGSFEGHSFTIYGLDGSHRKCHCNCSKYYFIIIQLDFEGINSRRFLEVRDSVYPITSMENGEMIPISMIGKKMFEYYNNRTNEDNNELYPRYDINNWTN